MECLTHLSTHPYMTRKTAGIDGYRRSYVHALTCMILSRHPQNTPIFHNRLFNCMAHAQCSASGNSAPRKMLVDAAHIHHTGNRGMIRKWYFAMRRNKYYLRYRMIQVLGNSKRLHITDPASPAGMHRVSDLVLAL